MPPGQPPFRSAAEQARRALVDGLYAEHAPALLRYLRRLAGPDDDPADLLHETFLRLWTQPDAAAIDNPRAWLFRVATNLSHNSRRDARRSRAREQAALDGRPMLDDAVRALEVRDRVADALEAVDDVRGRRALLLTVEGFTYREIADILELTPGHVGVLIQRARDQFRRRSSSRP